MEKDLRSLIILFKAHSSLYDQVKHSLLDSSLTVNEFTALEALYHKKVLTTSELIGSILVANSSMTYVLDTLEKKELIKRQKSEHDKRVQTLSLTEKGTQLFTKIYEKHYHHMRQYFDVLDPEEEKTLQNLLKKIGKAATD